MSGLAVPSTRERQAGFALLVLLGLIGVGSLSVVLALQAFRPPFAERSAAADARLATVQAAARAGFRGTGAFPADLDGIAAAASLPSAGPWRVDPYSAALELDYAISATGVRVRSRGPDRLLGSADDIRCDVATETQLRARQRGRLRLLRAQLLRSPYWLAPSMTASDAASMRTAMRAAAVATRQWFSATASERTALSATLAAAATTVAGLRAVHGLPSLPPALVGAGGLMQALGTSDARAVDGQGAAMRVDALLGVACVGADGTGGTDDDM